MTVVGTTDGRVKLAPDKERRDSLPVGKLYAGFAAERTGLADVDVRENEAIAHTVAKSAFAWKSVAERTKVRNEHKEKGRTRVLEILDSENNEEDEDDEVYALNVPRDELEEKVEHLLKLNGLASRLAPSNGAVEAASHSKVPHAMASWLRKRGYKVPSALSLKKRAELKECFELIDQDGSGHICVNELGQALSYLGVDEMSPKVNVVSVHRHLLRSFGAHGRLNLRPTQLRSVASNSSVPRRLNTIRCHAGSATDV